VRPTLASMPDSRSTGKKTAAHSAPKTITPKTPAPKTSIAKKAAPKSGKKTTGTPSAAKCSMMTTLKVPSARLTQITSSESTTAAPAQDTGALLVPGMIDINSVSASQVAPASNTRNRAAGTEDTPDTARQPLEKRATKSRNGANPDPIVPSTAATGAATPGGDIIIAEVTAVVAPTATSRKKARAPRGKAAREAAQAALVAEETTHEQTAVTAPLVENPECAAPTALSSEPLPPASTQAKKSRPASRSNNVTAVAAPVAPPVETVPAAENNVLHTDTAIPTEQVIPPAALRNNTRTSRFSSKKQTAKAIENAPVQPPAPTIRTPTTTIPAPVGTIPTQTATIPASPVPPATAPAKALQRKRAPRGKAAIAAAAAAAPTKPSLIVTLNVTVPPELTFTNMQKYPFRRLQHWLRLRSQIFMQLLPWKFPSPTLFPILSPVRVVRKRRKRSLRDKDSREEGLLLQRLPQNLK
jgi:hypothetical protein